MPVDSAASHSLSGRAPESDSTRRVQSFDVLGEPAGQLDAVAADVVEGKGGVEPGVRVVGHRDARQHPVDAEPPGVLQEVDAVRVAVRAVETPPDVGLADPVGDRVEVVVAETEAGPHRPGLGEVEDLGGGGPSAGECEQLRRHAEQRVGLRERAVGELDPQAVCRMRAVHDVAEAEARDDQRRVGLDVRAHDEDVAGFEGLVVGEQAEQDFAQYVDLAGGAVAAVHLDGAVVGLGCAAVGTDGVGGDVGLQPAEQRVGMASRLRGIRRSAVSAGRLRCSSRRSRPSVANSGWCDLAVRGVVAAGDRRLLARE